MRLLHKNVSSSLCLSDFAPFQVALCRECGPLVAMVRECWHQLWFTGCVKEQDSVISQLHDCPWEMIIDVSLNGNTHVEVSL